MLAKIYLAQSRKLAHLTTKRMRHAWVRAKLRYPVPKAVRLAPRARISIVYRAEDLRFRRTA